MSNPEFNGGDSRRSFLKQIAAATATIVATDLVTLAADKPEACITETAAETTPWYKRVTSWGQTNMTEMYPQRDDIAWWRKQWKRTNVGGIIVNAGGIVSYYPSTVPLHKPSQFLNGRDLFG